jgi:antitoxin component of MazEF toxin-antitoxin module
MMHDLSFLVIEPGHKSIRRASNDPAMNLPLTAMRELAIAFGAAVTVSCSKSLVSRKGPESIYAAFKLCMDKVRPES